MKNLFIILLLILLCFMALELAKQKIGNNTILKRNPILVMEELKHEIETQTEINLTAKDDKNI